MIVKCPIATAWTAPFVTGRAISMKKMTDQVKDAIGVPAMESIPITRDAIARPFHR